jgi:cell division control protein 7
MIESREVRNARRQLALELEQDQQDQQPLEQQDVELELLDGADGDPVDADVDEEMQFTNEESNDNEHADDDDENESPHSSPTKNAAQQSSSFSSSCDEEATLFLKSESEQEEIREEIEDLEKAVPSLKEDYRVIDRLGTGTFSSVYKAVDLGYFSKWDNSAWLGHHPPSSSAYYQSKPKEQRFGKDGVEKKVYVAIKRIYVTSSPERVRNEIAILEECRGCRHVSQLVTAFRERDQVVVIMPYQKNEDFRVCRVLLSSSLPSHPQSFLHLSSS